MRRILHGAIALVVGLSMAFTLATDADANEIAGGGYSSSYAGESIFTNVGAGSTGQFSAIFFNDGSQTWQPGVVGLLVCASDKTTCNTPQNTAFNRGWFSQSVYATVTAPVPPGSNGFFVYNFEVPPSTAPGTQTTFNGDVGLISGGRMLRPEGYYQINTVPAQTLVVTPSPASVAVGQTQQFTATGGPVGATITWSVTGGCGAITAAGLFAATSMNSATQPCTVVATSAAGSGAATVIVYGSPTQLSCTASPLNIVANGGISGGTSTATVTLKDPNGNTVANASSPQISIANVTPGLATMNPTGLQTPSGGAVTVSIATTNAPGAIQMSASAVGIQGCNVIINSAGPGNPSKTIASFRTNPIAADTISTSILQIDVTDSNGNRVTTDNATNITVTRDASSSFVCTLTGVVTGTGGSVGAGTGIATDVNGRVEFTVQATSTPGTCLFLVTTNNSSISGSSAAMTTQIVGAANKLAIISNDSPHRAASSGTCTVAGPNTNLSCTLIVVAVQDANGSTLTSDGGRAIGVGFDTSTCSGSSASPVVSNAPAESQGRATFAITSAGAYSGCVITFTSTNLSSAQTTAVWTGGGADHLTCSFVPNPIFKDGASTSMATVKVVDAAGNTVTIGNYTVSFNRTSGNLTTLLSPNPQVTSNGMATWTVRSGTTAGTETWRPDLQPGGGTLPGASQSCSLGLQ